MNGRAFGASVCDAGPRPLFIVLFGLNAIPKTIIGFLYAFVAMIINTLNGLDRVPSVLWKTAEVHHMARAAALRRIVFPLLHRMFSQA